MGRGSTEFDSLEGWLGHKTRSGGGGKFLSKWKDKGHCDTWMHVARLPLALWRHGFPMYVILDDKESGEKVKHVFGKKFVCHEDESVLTHPWRDKDTGLREKPPLRCGLCKLNDWLWIQCQKWVDSHRWEDGKWVEIKKGKGEGLDPCTKMFEFESEHDAKENVTMYAGGICNFFGQKNLDEDVKSAAKKAKIRLDEIFKQNANVKCEYAMCVVDNDNVAGGMQIAVETQALGDAVKAEIQRVYKSEERNIQKSPYLIQWEYHEKESFSKKYTATSMMKIKPSERVLKLIRGTPPDLTELKTPFNQQQMRATLEKNCLIDSVPWSELFPSKKQEEAWKEADEEEEEETEETETETEEEETETREPGSDDVDEEEDEEEEEEKPAPKKKTASKKKDEEEEDDGDKVACDECGKPMDISASKCPHCGHKYEVEEEEEEEEEEAPKPKLKSRSEAKSEAKKKSSDKKPSKKKDDEEEDDDQDAEIPF